MKRILLFASVMALALVSCKKEEQITPEIKVEQKEYAVTVDGTGEDFLSVKFTSNVDWTASVSADAREWFTATPLKGVSGESTLKVSILKNEGNDARTAVITIIADTAKETITFTQAQKDAFSLVKDSETLDENGGTVALKVMTNVAYTVNIPADATWITKEATKAYGEQTTNLSVAAYDVVDGTRSAKITVSAEGFDDLTFTIIQNGATSKLWSVDMHSVMNRVASYAPAEGEKAGTMVSIASWGDKIVVCAGDGSNPVLLDKATGEKKGTLDIKDAKAMYVTNDDAGNLVFCNRVYNYWTSSVFFTIWYMKPGDDEPTKLVSTHDVEYYPSYLGAKLSVRGDVTGNAAIAAPWEGVPGITGDNMVLCWNVKAGKTEPLVKTTLTGFIGISWSEGYWIGAPNNFPAYTLVADNLESGALFSMYSENVVYYVDKDGKCTKVHEFYIPYYDEEQQAEVNVIGNYNSGTIDVRTINGKTYGAIELSEFWGGLPVINVYELDLAAGKVGSLVYSPVDLGYYTTEDDAKEPHSELTSTCASLVMEEATGGFNLYHINNSCSSIEAFHVPVK